MSSITVTLKEEVEKVIRETGFSGAISIKQGGERLFWGAAGYADRTNCFENRDTTRFGIASATKFLTALAIGMLFEEGKLSFSSRLFDLIENDFPTYSEEITIGHLLTHSSGIPDYFDVQKIEDFNSYFIQVPWYSLEGPTDYLPILPGTEMKFKPGTKFSYSRSGYILLGAVIERLSQMRYQDYIIQRIFKPAGMTSSGFFPLNSLPPDTAIGYIDEREGYRTNVYNLPILGSSDGGAFSTLADIERLWEAFYGYELLAKELVDLYISPLSRAPLEGEKIYYGHGVWIYRENSKLQSEYVCGCEAGASFNSSNDRTNEVQITVMSNTTGGAWPVMDVINSFF